MQYSDRVIIEGANVKYELRWKNPDKLKRTEVFETREFQALGLSWYLQDINPTLQPFRRRIRLYRAVQVVDRNVEILGGYVSSKELLFPVRVDLFAIQKDGRPRKISQGDARGIFELFEPPTTWNELVDEKEHGLRTNEGAVLMFSFGVRAQLISRPLSRENTLGLIRLTNLIMGGKSSVNVEIITDETICDRLRSSCLFGLVSSNRKRNSFLFPTELHILQVPKHLLILSKFVQAVEVWKKIYEKSHAFFCKIKGRNHFSVGIQLSIDKYQGEELPVAVPNVIISEGSWAVIYLTSIPDLKDGMIVCFTKMFNHETSEIRFVGSSLIKSGDDTFELFSQVAKSLPNQPFDLYLEKYDAEPGCLLSRIEGWKSTAKNGLYSGCCVVAVHQQPEIQMSFQRITEVVNQTYAVNIEISDSDDKESSEPEGFESDNDLCVVCMSKPKSVTLIHSRTGHKCLCSECATNLEQTANPLCPICRQPVQHFLDATF